MSAQPQSGQTPRWSLPPLPYLGLAQYEAAQTLLFAGRELHVDACAEVIAQSETRMLLLHGQTGCGKSSFLRAGLIPGLETRGFGYLFLRKPPETPDGVGEPVFIRCGDDPLANLARAIFDYVAQPLVVSTARGPKEVDLRAAQLGIDSCEEFVRQCADPDKLLAAFAAISANLPHTLVVVLDQMEEVLTLNPPDSANCLRFFTFLKLFNISAHRAKLILSLRKDHSGEFIGLAQLDNSVKAEFKIYLLPDMTGEEVLRAIVLPTSKEDLEGAGSPHSQYRFSFAPGLAQSIVDDLFELVPKGAILPVMQILCKELYATVRSGPEPWLIDGTLYNKSRVEGCIRRHVATALDTTLRELSVDAKSIREEARRWRQVLYHLVRYEGDGRVHTDVMSRSAFRDSARKEKTLADSDEVFDELACPDVLVLRKLVVPGTNEGMCSLGHDVIGLALYAMRIEDEAAEREAKRRALRVRIALGVAGLGIAAVLGLAGLNVLSRANLAEKSAAALLHSVQDSFRSDPETAAVNATSAVALKSKALFANSDGQAREILAALQRAMPDRRLDLPGVEKGDRTQHQLLNSPPGIVSIQSDGRIIVQRLTPAGTLAAQEFKSIMRVDIPTDAFLSVSEPFADCILILLSSYSVELDQRYRLWILRNGTLQGPYTGKVLLNKINPLLASEGRPAIPELDTSDVASVLLSGDVVMLVTTHNGRSSVRTLLANEDLTNNSDYFSAGVSFAMDQPPQWSTTHLTIPTQQQITAERLFSVHYKPVELLLKPDNLIVESLEAQSLRGESHKAWAHAASELRSIAQCNKEGGCGMNFVGNPVVNRLRILSVRWTMTKEGQGDASRNDSRTPPAGFYVVLDTDSGSYREVPFGTLQSARKPCTALPEHETNDENVGLLDPSFVDGTLDNLLFGFVHDRSVQLVNVRDGRAACSERLFPSDIREWRFVPARNLLLARSEQQLMSWQVAPATAQ